LGFVGLPVEALGLCAGARVRSAVEYGAGLGRCRLGRWLRRGRRGGGLCGGGGDGRRVARGAPEGLGGGGVWVLGRRGSPEPGRRGAVARLGQQPREVQPQRQVVRAGLHRGGETGDQGGIGQRAPSRSTGAATRSPSARIRTTSQTHCPTSVKKKITKGPTAG